MYVLFRLHLGQTGFRLRELRWRVGSSPDPAGRQTGKKSRVHRPGALKFTVRLVDLSPRTTTRRPPQISAGIFSATFRRVHPKTMARPLR